MGKTRILACAIGLALGAAACGDDDDDLTTVQAGTGSVRILDATVPIEGSAGTDGSQAGSGGSAADAGRRDAGAIADAGNDSGAMDAGTDAAQEDASMQDAAPPSEPPTILLGVGNFGLRASSEDGTTWTICGNSGGGDNHSPDLLRNVAYGDGIFVAVGGDRNSMVMRSADGVRWEEDLHPTDACPGEPYPNTCLNWMGGVAFGDGVWLAGGGNGALIRSTDAGKTWEGVKPAMNVGPIRDITWGSGLFVASNDNGALLVSEDNGDSWTSHPVWTHPMQVTAGGGTFVAFGSAYNGSGFDYACFVSTDGGSVWNSCPGLISHANSFAYDGTQWVAAIDDAFATSTDGVEWVEQPQPPGTPSGILFTGELWFGRSDGAIVRSSDLNGFQQAAPAGTVPGFNAWTSGKVTMPDAIDAPECEDNR